MTLVTPAVKSAAGGIARTAAAPTSSENAAVSWPVGASAGVKSATTGSCAALTAPSKKASPAPSRLMVMPFHAPTGDGTVCACWSAPLR